METASVVGVSTECYLCGQPNTELVVANESYSYVVCRACGFRRRDPIPTTEQEERLYEDDYYADRGLVTSLDGVGKHLRELIGDRVAVLTELNGTPGTLLDVGAGTGLFMEASIRAGWRAVGVETSLAASRIAAGVTSGLLLQGRVEDLTFDEMFDAATMWDVLEHLPDPRATLRAIRNRLKPGGIIGISLPNVAGLKARIRGNSWRYYQHSFGHISHFSPHTLGMLLGQAGFVPERLTMSGAFNVGRPFGLDPDAVHANHRVLTWVQSHADRIVGRVGLGESLVAFARAGTA